MSRRTEREGVNDRSMSRTAPDPPETGPPAAPFWLSSAKVTVPERVVGYVHRPGLPERVAPTGHRVTVLKAPAGFGKTVLMAESCRELRNAGTVAAWLTLDGDDAPQTLDTYIAFAFERAGVDVGSALDATAGEGHRRPGFEYRIGLLGVALERHETPCVLVLDELERLDDSGSLELVNLLLRRGPPNLHILVGCRELPASLDVASHVLDGSGRVLAEEDLRFSRPDVARFLGPDASRRRVDAVAQESRGWPIALRVLGNEQLDATPESGQRGMDLADNWMESRLLARLSDIERDLVLDAGLFDWIDAGLLDEVLGTTGALRRLEAVPALAGLLESVRLAAADALRLHALIREHAARRRQRDTPDRFRRVHRAIAVALARRGETVLAMRHAAAAHDETLVGDILEDAGGPWLWSRAGLAPLQAADRLLTEALIARRPRLALARSLAMLLTGRPREADALYRAVAGPLREPAEGPEADDSALVPDETLVRGMLALCGCEQTLSAHGRTLIAAETRLAADDRLDPLIRSSFEHGLCIAHNQAGEFDAALDWERRARRGLPTGHFVEVYLELQRGQIGMARGEVALAARCYTRALREVRASYLRDPDATVVGQALMAELDLERNRLQRIQVAARSPAAHFEGANYFVPCAARAGVALDVTREREGIQAALSLAEGMLDYAHTTARALLVRLLAAERVSLLAAAGHVAEAKRAWRLDELPDEAEACLDVPRLAWRGMEAVACARLRLLTADGRFDEGRRFLEQCIAVASERDLWRTRMRVLALGVALEYAAGCPPDAERRLDEFLRLFAQADYARPLVREHAACLPVLEAFVADRTDSPSVDDARRLLAMLAPGAEDENTEPTFSDRELDVLQQLESRSDKEIARSMSLTPRGVRYHVGNIFDKLEVRNRRAAVRRAREIGLLP